ANATCSKGETSSSLVIDLGSEAETSEGKVVIIKSDTYASDPPMSASDTTLSPASDTLSPNHSRYIVLFPASGSKRKGTESFKAAKYAALGVYVTSFKILKIGPLITQLTNCLKKLVPSAACSALAKAEEQ